MQYRSFGKLGKQVSALGFGCMRFPTTDGVPTSGNINEDEAIRMVRHAIDNGVNYVDTAYPYHQGRSELVVGMALKDGYRERVTLATKSPVWLIKEAADFDKYLNEQLQKLQTDHIDCYLLHSLGKNSWRETVLKLGLLEKAEAAKADGRIRQIGFSFHDDNNTFVEIVDGYDKWDFCQIQYNYMDVENQAGTKGLQYAAGKGLAVVVMEPLLGGKLANPPASVRDIFAKAAELRSPAEWALQWVWNQPEVSLLLSGMSAMSQVEDNLKAAGRSGVGSLSSDDLRLIKLAQQEYQNRTAVGCTGCSYCMPCPNSVDIPRNFKMYNDGYMYDDVKGARSAYTRFMAEESRASACLQCQACEEKCPQKIAISELMPKVHAVLGEGRSY